MICPHCTDTKLQVVVRDGIEIDICPRCRGMWLDHGELTRLMTADTLAMPTAPIPADQYDPDAFGDEGWDGAETEDRIRSKERKPKDEKPEARKSKREGKRRKQKRRGKKSKKRKPPSWSRRLGEIIEDVIDELD